MSIERQDGIDNYERTGRPLFPDTQGLIGRLNDNRPDGSSLDLMTFRVDPRKDLVVYRYGKGVPTGIMVSSDGKEKMAILNPDGIYYNSVLEKADKPSKSALQETRNSLNVINGSHSLWTLGAEGQVLLGNADSIPAVNFEYFRTAKGNEGTVGKGLVVRGLVDKVEGEFGSATIVFPSETLVIPVLRPEEHVVVIPLVTEEEFAEIKEKARQSLEERGLVELNGDKASKRPSFGSEGYRRPRDVKKGLGRKKGKSVPTWKKNETKDSSKS